MKNIRIIKSSVVWRGDHSVQTETKEKKARA